MAIRGCWGCIGAGRECRYSGARSGIGGIRGHWGLLGGVGVSGGIKGCRGVTGAFGVAGVLGAQSHWAPVQGPSTPTGSPWGVTYLTKARQVTEMSSAGYYIHLELYLVTVCTFVSTLPNHIFLHAM